MWGVGQTVTWPLSDRWGRKGLIVAGVWVQALGLLLTGATGQFVWWFASSVLLGVGTAMVYPSLIAAVSDASTRAGATGLSVSIALARPWLCDRRLLRRPHCGLVRLCRRDPCYRGAHISFRSRGRNRMRKRQSRCYEA